LDRKIFQLILNCIDLATRSSSDSAGFFVFEIGLCDLKSNMCVGCADKKEKIPEKIQVQRRSVLIANNFLIALFNTPRFSLDYFTGWPDGEKVTTIGTDSLTHAR
jgi:hypothetical protein